MTLAAMGTLETEAKVQHLHTLVLGGALRKFDSLSTDVKITETPLDVDDLHKGLAWYLPPCKFTFKTEACNAPLYGKSTELKGKALCCALD